MVLLKRIFGSVLTLIGASDLAPFGRDFIRAIFWDRVVHVTDPILRASIEFALDYALPIVIVMIGLSLLAGPERRYGYANWLRKKLNIYLVIAGVATLVLVGAVIGYFIDQLRGPIDWVLDSPGSPIEFYRAPDGPLVVSGFRIIGTSRSDLPAPLQSAFIRSDITGETIPFKFGIPGGEIGADEAVVEPHGSVNMFAAIPASEDQRKTGISLDWFTREFGRFTFMLEYADGKKFEKSFSSQDVEILITKAGKQQAQLQSHPPTVIRKRRNGT